MSLIPRNSLFDFDNIFENFWAPMRPGTESPNAAFMPRVDIKDNKDHIEISAELPGVKKEDIHVTLENGVLTLSAESHQEDKEEKEGKIIRQERRYGKYIRSFSIGSGIQESDIKASFKDGVLKLSAPKAKETEPEKRRIEIFSGVAYGSDVYRVKDILLQILNHHTDNSAKAISSQNSHAAHDSPDSELFYLKNYRYDG